MKYFTKLIMHGQLVTKFKKIPVNSNPIFSYLIYTSVLFCILENGIAFQNTQSLTLTQCFIKRNSALQKKSIVCLGFPKVNGDSSG